MISVLIGLVALLMVFIAISLFLKVKRSLITGGIAGLVAGFMLGLFACMLPGFTHYFGPVEIPDPIIQIGGVATGMSEMYPPIMAVMGLIVGLFLGARRKTNS